MIKRSVAIAWRARLAPARPTAMWRFAMTTMLCAGALAACGDDDPEPQPVDSAPMDSASDSAAPDTVEDAGGDTVADTTIADADGTIDTDGPDYGPLEVVDPLPLAADYDPDYVALGDAVVTTLRETWRTPYGMQGYLTTSGQPRVEAAEFGRLVAQPGEPFVVRDQLALSEASREAVPSNQDPIPATASSLFFSFILADPQLVDSETPAQIPKNAAFDLAGFSLPAAPTPRRVCSNAGRWHYPGAPTVLPRTGLSTWSSSWAMSSRMASAPNWTGSSR